jgi:hypothetical protein
VIKDTTKGERGRLKLSSSGVKQERNITKTLEFFLENNPGHVFGDCFCVSNVVLKLPMILLT